MSTPAELVAHQFSLAQSYASNAQSQMASFTAALTDSIYVAPILDITWQSIQPPVIPAIPNPPTLPEISFEAPNEPSAFTEVAPIIDLDEFTETPPETNFPVAPVISYGEVPVVPEVGEVVVPEAPEITLPVPPEYLTLTTPTFDEIDFHEDFLAKLADIPALELMVPTPYIYAPGPAYASELLAALTATLLERIAGGTGLDPAVEAALWDRARSRETHLSLANEAEIMRQSEALGFMLPSGALAAQLREAQQTTYDKASSLSRDIAIKQAELEQANLKDTIAQGIELEGKLIDYSYKLEQLTFENAKMIAENALGMYNAQVEQYKALLAAYNTYAVVYKTVMEAEMMKVEVYKAEIAAEQAKADVNKTMVDQYKAEIEASLAVVEIYKAEVSAAQTLVELEQTKISAAGEQIKAFVATVNAETAKIEAYKVSVDAETAKLGVYKIKADVFSTVVSAQAEEARLRLSEYTSKAQVKSNEWDAYKAVVEAERSRMTALASQSSSLTDGYRAASTATEATANTAARLWETQIKEYETGINTQAMQYKINNDYILDTQKVKMDAAKVGAQVYAQLAASSYTMANANASISGTGGTSVSYSYSNDTTAPAPPLFVY